MQQRPTLFIDLDDVLCLNNPYGGMHLRQFLLRPSDTPADFWPTLFSPAATEALSALMEEMRPRTVLTSSWIGLLDRHHFVHAFEMTGLSSVGAALHGHWDAEHFYGASRFMSIRDWLSLNHNGEPFLVLDDHDSGEGLLESLWYKRGRVVLCDVGVGFHAGHLDTARYALRTPCRGDEI